MGSKKRLFKHSRYGVLIFCLYHTKSKHLYQVFKVFLHSVVYALSCFIPLSLLSDGWRVQAHPEGGNRQIWECFVPHPRQPKQKNKIMADDLKKVADLITANTIFCTKEVLTSEETARYMGISLSYLYKLTMRQQIPHYKPMGKMCYFNRVEVEEWLQRNRVATDVELSDRASAYCMKGGVR